MKLAAWTRRGLGLVIGVAVIAVVSVVVVAFAFDHDDPAPEAPAVARDADPRNALCDAAAAARQGDAPTARQIFFSRSHQALHLLAATAQAKSRAAAAALLEAKAKVEAGFDPPAASLGEDLEALALMTGRAMAAAGGNDPGLCGPTR